MVSSSIPAVSTTQSPTAATAMPVPAGRGDCGWGRSSVAREERETDRSVVPAGRWLRRAAAESASGRSVRRTSLALLSMLG